MKPEKYFKDKVVLITGGSMGIGKEMARQLLEMGSKVTITGRNEQRLLAVKEEFKVYEKQLLVNAGDVSDYEDNVKLVEKIVSSFGHLDVLVNNAGMSAYGELSVMSHDVIGQMIDINIKGSLYPTRAAYEEIKKSKGAILFISSVAGFRGLPSYSLYSLTKMSITGLYETLRLENKQYGVFTGVSYIGFTENEPEKRALAYNGQLAPIPQRGKMVTRSRSQTARILIKQIAAKKPRVIHSFVGKATYILCKYLPFISRIVYGNIYKNQKKQDAVA